MLRGMAPLMEKHFGVRIRDEAITEAVRLSARYITGRQLPDKAISVLDTACAKVALGQAATPAAVDELRKRLERLATEIAALQREAASGSDHAARLSALRTQRDNGQAELDALLQRHEAEKALVGEVQQLRQDLEAAAARDHTEQAPPATPLPDKLAALGALQGEAPLVPVDVDGNVVAAIVAAWTGIPLGKMVKDDLKTVLNLQPLLEARVIGQSTRWRPSPSGCAPAAPTWRTRTSPRACSCSSAPAAWARPRPPWPWPTCSTAARRSSSPST
jgi:type VI secretion system protein VasG